MFFYSKDYLHGPHTLSDADGVETPWMGTPTTHHWLPGDRVDPDSGAVLARAPKQTFVGIVDFANRTTQGFSPRGVPLYLFHPLQRGAPPFLVAAKTRPSENMFARVAFEHWEGKWPRGGIQALLGTVGDPAAERTAHIAAAAVAAAPPLAATVAPPPTDVLTGTEALPWDVVCNIDPPGCRDVDDVFCLRRDEDGTLVFGIAIADVAAWVPPDSALDAAAAAAGATFYVDGTPVHPMLPPALSEGTASLLADDLTRPTLALVFRIRDGAIVDTAWRRLALRVTLALTYATAAASPVASDLVAALRAVCAGWTADVEADPHAWVEQAMVLYNARAAAVLRAAGQGILRITQGRLCAAEAWADLAARTGIPALAHMGAAAGRYVAAGSAAAESGHAGLGLAHYCHASSPLRRYADLSNQRKLRAILFGDSGDSGDHAPPPTPHLNWRNRLYKDLERELWFLQHISLQSLTQTHGVVVRSGVALDADTWKLTVYCPEWKRLCRARAAVEIAPATPVVLTVYMNPRAVKHGERIVCRAMVL